jgi:cytochrome P450
MSEVADRQLSPDLSDAGFLASSDGLHEFWADIRQREPVFWHEAGPGRPGFWVVSRYPDVRDCYANGAELSSARGTVLDVLLRGTDSAGGKMLAVTDDPRHRSLRKLMLRALSPRVLRDTEEKIFQRTRELVGQRAGAGPFDFASAVADKIPLQTICDLLAVPEDDREQLLSWNKQTLSSTTPDADVVTALSARSEIVLYFTNLAAERRENPGSDPISILATGEVDGSRLTIDEVALNCYSLILGGDESSRMAAITSLKALADFPDQWRMLRDSAVKIDVATEELLRWSTPAMHFARMATTDTVIGGKCVSEGDIVTLWNISANNDEAVFERPELLWLSRWPNKHVSFGWGNHFCLGSFLGRASLRSLLRGLVETVSDIEVEARPKRLYSNFLFGYQSLRTEMRAA